MKITMKRNKKDYSENKINVYQICLVALAVGINIVGGQIALFMKLPVYLDSIGTILTGAVLGPWFGMLPNLISGIFMGMTVDIYSLYFAPVGMITGIMSGLVFRKESKSVVCCSTDHCTGNDCKFCDQCSIVWRCDLIRIFDSGPASFQNTAWTDRKYLCSTVSDRLSGQMHFCICSKCICDDARWRIATETDGECA
mgnify:CR=1 FL=1